MHFFRNLKFENMKIRIQEGEKTEKTRKTAQAPLFFFESSVGRVKHFFLLLFLSVIR